MHEKEEYFNWLYAVKTHRAGKVSQVSDYVQEELAFVFEMLQQFEDALVQYDELDALFTQYVLNFGAGGTWR